MKYIVRSLKYFVFLTMVLCLVILIMVKLGLAESDIDKMFVHGYDSLWQMGLIMAAFAAIYPKFGYCRRTADAPGPEENSLPALMDVMEEHGYRLVFMGDSEWVFVKRMLLTRVLKMWEDKVTVTKSLLGYEFEGLTKDVVRVVSAFSAKVSIPPAE